MAKRDRGRDLPSALFCDASYLIAYFATNDQYHRRAQKIGKRLDGWPVRLLTSWPSLSEASTLLLYHYGYSHAIALLHSLRAFEVITPFSTEYEEARELFGRRNKDQKLSFNDLLTAVLIRGRLKNAPVLTFDRDFSRMGLTIFSP